MWEKKLWHGIVEVEKAGKKNARKRNEQKSRNFVCHKPALGVIQSRQLLRLRFTKWCDKFTQLHGSIASTTRRLTPVTFNVYVYE